MASLTPSSSPRVERRLTRRAVRALKVAEEAALGNASSPLVQLPDELLLRVVSCLLQPSPGPAEEAAGTADKPRAKQIAALLLVCRRFMALREAINQSIREEVHALWSGSEIRKLPGLCKSWHHMLHLLEQQQVAVSFRWSVPNWSTTFQREAANRTYSSSFSAGGFSWRLLMFPRGNTVPFLSLYLAVTSEFRQRLPSTWTKFARFALIVPNKSGPALVKATQHQFDNREDDWGFTQLLELSELADPTKGWVVDDVLTLEALILPFSEPPVRQYVTLSWTGEATTSLGV